MSTFASKGIKIVENFECEYPPQNIDAKTKRAYEETCRLNGIRISSMVTRIKEKQGRVRGKFVVGLGLKLLFPDDETSSKNSMDALKCVNYLMGLSNDKCAEALEPVMQRPGLMDLLSHYRPDENGQSMMPRKRVRTSI